MIALGMTILMMLCDAYNMKAGVLSIEDYYIYTIIISKPYCKFQTHSVGVLFAFIYLDILKYRKETDE